MYLLKAFQVWHWQTKAAAQRILFPDATFQEKREKKEKQKKKNTNEFLNR